MKTKWLKRAIVAPLLIGIVSFASTSVANAVVIRVDNGMTWTVGKGDVQSLFGWNARETDREFEGVTFRYEKLTTKTGTCEFNVVSGSGKSRVVEEKSEENHSVIGVMTRELQYHVKKNSQGNVTGATIWPGESSTTVESPKLCTNLTYVLGEGESLQGNAVAKEVSMTVTEQIFVIHDLDEHLLWSSTESATEPTP